MRVDAGAVEALMRAVAGVVEVRALDRIDASGVGRMTAFLVLDRRSLAKEVRAAALQAASAADVTVLDILVLPALPIDDDGTVDVAALSRIPVIDDALRAAAESEARRRGAKDAAAAIEPRAPVQRLSLADVLPDWTAGIEAPAAMADINAATMDGEPSELTGAPLDPALLPGERLFELLDHAARIAPQRGITFSDEDGRARRLAYPAFLASAEAWLTKLAALGVREGDRLIFQLSDPQDFLTAFWACQLGGIVAVPLPPIAAVEPGADAFATLAHVWRVLDEPLVLVGHGRAKMLMDGGRACGLKGARIIDIAALVDGAAAPLPPRPATRPGDLAMLAFTSGSTGTPKGVRVTQAMMCRRAAGMRQTLALGADDISVNWMPLDHVASIIMGHLWSVAARADQTQVATAYVLADIVRWLDLLETHAGTWTWAPNFAFALVNDAAAKVAARPRQLGTLRYALNGGEAVQPATAAAWLKLLAPHGVRPDAILPAWGMAETSSIALGNAGFVADPGATGVPVGPPLPDCTVRIVNADGAVVPQGAQGRLLIRGATITPGYFQDPETDAESFQDGWMDTGDLAVADHRGVTITGRAKNVIIINGLNHGAAEIEAVIDALPGVRTSFTAAAAVRRPGDRTDGLAIFFVPQSNADDPLRQTIEEIRETLASRLGLSADYLVPLSDGAVPKTSLGKVRRPLLVRGLADGAFDSDLRRADLLAGGDARTLPAWFYRRRWAAKRATPDTGIANARVLIVGHDDPIDGAVARAVAADGPDVVRAIPGVRFAQTGAGRFTVDPDSAEDFGQLLARLAEDGTPVSHIVYLLNYRPADARRRRSLGRETLDDAVHHLRSLAAALATNGQPIRLIAASVGTEEVSAGDTVDAPRALIAGYLRSLPLEVATLDAVHLDLEGLDEAADARAIAVELQTVTDDADVAVRGPTRRAARLDPIVPGGGQSPLVTAGRYIITGGLGGAGQLIARHLLRTHQASVLLVGRSAPDAAVLAGLSLESGDISYVQADVGDAYAWSRLFEDQKARWGGVDAVFHLAGHYAEQSLGDPDRSVIMATLAAKAEGALAIAESLRGSPKTALVAFSSELALTGGAEVGAYAAANQFVESLVEALVADGLKAWSIAWPVLDVPGMNSGARTAAVEAAGGLVVSGTQMLATLAAVLASPPGRMIVTDPRGPLAARGAGTALPALEIAYEAPAGTAMLAGWQAVDAFGTPVAVRPRRLEALPRTADGAIDREALAGHGAGGDTEDATEAMIAGVWRSVLGISRIGRTESLFALGVNSLRVMELASALTAQTGDEWSLRDMFEHATIAEQAALVRIKAPAVAVEDIASPIGQTLPLTSAQERMWFLHRIDPASPAYAIEASITFAGKPDIPALESALSLVVERHPALRAIFPAVDGRPVQRIRAAEPITLTIEPVSADRLTPEINTRATAPYDLEHGPAFRFHLLAPSDSEAHLLLINLHHIVGDGWSVRVLFEDILAAYEALAAGEAPPPPRANRDYLGYLTAEQSVSDPARRASDLVFWRRQLDGISAGSELIGDRPRPGVPSLAGHRLTHVFDTATADAIRGLARDARATLFPVLFAAYAVLLARIGRNPAVSVGTVAANRDRSDRQGIVGCLLNLVALRLDIRAEEAFADLVVRARGAVLDAFEHAAIPFETIVDELLPERDPTRAPLFQVAFDVQDDRITAPLKGAAALSVAEAELGTARYDFHLTVKDMGARLLCSWDYATDLFDAASIEWLAKAYEALLVAAAADPGTPVAKLPLLREAERTSVLQDLNRTDRPDFDLDRTVLHRIAGHVARRPDAAALSYGGEELSYAALDRRSDRVAAALTEMGARAGTVVAICLPRGFDLIVAIIGVLKTGAAYTPVDPAYPATRVTSMIEDAKPVVAIVDRETVALVQDCPTITIAELDAQEATTAIMPPRPDDAAYVVFTSGSTGRPKGVVVGHRALANLVQGNGEGWFVDESARQLQFSALGFDAMVTETFTVLAAGGTLVMAAPDDMRPGTDLLNVLRSERVSHAIIPPSVLNVLPSTDLPDLRVLVSAGEPCPPAIVQRWGRDRAFFNGYGPTETTVCAAYKRCDPDDAAPPTLGRPMPNYRCYVVDEGGMPVPPRWPGELWIGGASVAERYIGRPDLTAERFADDPFCDTGRIYRSGDLVRWTGNDELDYLGRVDAQVKLRGFRIEPGEIEVMICKQPGIIDAAVVVQTGDEGQKLAAYVVPARKDGQPITAAVLRDGLRGALPGFMVPDRIEFVDALPLTPNGKVDRARLAALRPAPIVTAVPAAVEPADAMQDLVRRIWREVLENSTIALDDNFFDVGGHSLRMAQVQARLEAALRRSVALVLLFQHPTIRTLAAALDEQAPRPAADVRQATEDRSREGARRLVRLAARRQN